MRIYEELEERLRVKIKKTFKIIKIFMENGLFVIYLFMMGFVTS